MLSIMLSALVAGPPAPASAAVPGDNLAALPAKSAELPTTARLEILDRLSAAMNRYVDPSVGMVVKAMLARRRSAHAAIGDRDLLARTLSNDLLTASKDLHLKVSLATLGTTAELTPDEQLLLESRLAHGLLAIRRLPANIGYLKLRYFASGRDGEALIDAAMLMLKDSDALIIDLRENTGGGGASDERLLGHLSRDPIPMASIHWRQPDGSWKVEQRRTSPPPTGALYPDKPLFLLTAKRTFSAAEGFALDLKASSRALLIGERTRGGANPGRSLPLGHGMDVFVPSGRVTHPLTGGNWNGTGVQPHVEVPASAALTEAYRRALAKAKPTIATPKSIEERDRAIADPEAALLADQQL